ncbi:MAG: TIGR00266 family protein [Spirochaetaceae bacterium]|nr:TIGR00266 family protein [Spirochaetaceae bacterium]
MKIEIVQRPASSAARVALDAGEHMTAEGGSMIAMSGDMEINTTTHKKEGGGVLKGLARTLGGEGLFMNHFTAGPDGGEVILSTALTGDMEALELDGSTPLMVQRGSFVAHESSVDMSISWQGLKNVFSGENMIWLKMNGSGSLIINAFGALYPVDVDGEYIVDTGNIAAFEDSLTYKISKAGKSFIASMLGGEGLVCRFSGKGRVWCQTHADRNFGASLKPHLRPKKK